MRKAIPSLTLFLLSGLLAIQVGCSKDDDPVEPPATCSITMTAPAAGDTIKTSENISIRWDRTTGEAVRIELFKGGVLAGTIVDNYTYSGSSGFYPWSDVETFDQGTAHDYSIKVTSVQNPDCFDQTASFTMKDVSNCYIAFPWAGRDSIPDLAAGNDFLITWDSNHTGGLLDIELWYQPFTDPVDLVGYIARDLPDTGSYLWEVDSFNWGSDEGFRFKIIDIDNVDCQDISMKFDLKDEVICTIEVWGLSGGHTYIPDEVVPLSFVFENSPGVVNLRLYSGNVPVRVPPLNGIIVDNFDTQNGTVLYNWTVSSLDYGGPEHNRYNIRAFDVDDEYCWGKSDDFSIQQ